MSRQEKTTDHAQDRVAFLANYLYLEAILEHVDGVGEQMRDVQPQTCSSERGTYPSYRSASRAVAIFEPENKLTYLTLSTFAHTVCARCDRNRILASEKDDYINPLPPLGFPGSIGLLLRFERRKSRNTSR